MPVLRTAGMHQSCTPHGSRGTQYQLPLMCEPELELPSLPVSACSDLWMSRTLFRNGFVGSSGRMRQTGNQRADLKRLLGQVSAPDTFSIDDPSNCFRFPGYGLQQAETVAKIVVAYLKIRRNRLRSGQRKQKVPVLLLYQQADQSYVSTLTERGSPQSVFLSITSLVDWHG
jgi:hypothetical protein